MKLFIIFTKNILIMKLNKSLYDTWHDNIIWLKQRITDQNKNLIPKSDTKIYTQVDIDKEQNKINIYYERVKYMSFKDKVEQLGLSVGCKIEVIVYLITNNVKSQEFKYLYKIESINLDNGMYTLAYDNSLMEVEVDWFILENKRNFKLLQYNN